MCAIEMQAYNTCMVQASIQFISCAMQQCEWHSWNTLYAILNIYIFLYVCQNYLILCVWVILEKLVY
jgi:hypothetical protein